MGGRIYTANYSAKSTTAISDLFEITAPSNAVVKLLSCRIGPYGDAGDVEAETLPIAIVRYSTGGSGGSSPTPRPHLNGSAATGVTVEANNTTQGGSPATILPDAFNVQAGWLYIPTPEEWIFIPPNGILAIELPVAPNDAILFQGSITFEELD